MITIITITSFIEILAERSKNTTLNTQMG